jgi:hypothetical protein
MSRWWRAYDEAVDDPKLQKLPGELFKAWFNLCCITSQNDGVLPDIDAVAFKLRTTAAKAKQTIEKLKEAGLIDEEEGVTEPHNWRGRQYKSDVTDATAAERMRRYRKNRNGVTANTVTVTLTRDRADTEQNRTEGEDGEDAPSSSKVIFFESGVIRLTRKDYEKWRDAFTNLDLKAELLGLTEWAGGQESWYFAVSSALAKKNREMGLRREGVRALEATPRRGIPGII